MHGRSSEFDIHLGFATVVNLCPGQFSIGEFYSQIRGEEDERFIFFKGIRVNAGRFHEFLTFSRVRLNSERLAHVKSESTLTRTFQSGDPDFSEA